MHVDLSSNSLSAVKRLAGLAAQQGIGLGYVATEAAKKGSSIEVVIRGYNTSGSTVSYMNPLNSSYQSSTYAWMKAGGGHTLTHTLYGAAD